MQVMRPIKLLVCPQWQATALLGPQTAQICIHAISSLCRQVLQNVLLYSFSSVLCHKQSASLNGSRCDRYCISRSGTGRNAHLPAFKTQHETECPIDRARLVSASLFCMSCNNFAPPRGHLFTQDETITYACLHVEEWVIVQVAVIVHVRFHAPVEVKFAQQRMKMEEAAAAKQSTNQSTKVQYPATNPTASQMPDFNSRLSDTRALFFTQSSGFIKIVVRENVSRYGYMHACSSGTCGGTIPCLHTEPLAVSSPAVHSLPLWGRHTKGNPSAPGELRRTAFVPLWLPKS